MVHVVNEGRPFFFPGFFLFPLFFLGLFFVIGGIFRGAGRFGWKGHHGPGPWNEEGRKRFDDRATEWHEQQHGGSPPGQAAPTL